MFVRQQYRREYGKGLPHKKPIASETDACKMKSFVRLGGLKEAPASIGGEYFTLRHMYGAGFFVIWWTVTQCKKTAYEAAAPIAADSKQYNDKISLRLVPDRFIPDGASSEPR